MFPPAFFNIVKKLLVQKQTVPQRKGLIFSFLELESLRAWYYESSYQTNSNRNNDFDNQKEINYIPTKRD